MAHRCLDRPARMSCRIRREAGKGRWKHETAHPVTRLYQACLATRVPLELDAPQLTGEVMELLEQADRIQRLRYPEIGVQTLPDTEAIRHVGEMLISAIAPSVGARLRTGREPRKV